MTAPFLAILGAIACFGLTGLCIDEWANALTDSKARRWAAAGTVCALLGVWLMVKGAVR